MVGSDRQLDELRRNQSALENHVVDELLEGRLDRRTFIRRGAAIGMALPSISMFLAACGGSKTETTSAGAPVSGTPKRGGTLRVGVTKPTGAIEPITAGNQGAISMLLPGGEYLVQSQPDLSLVPALASKWTPNTDGSVWTFELREGVTFHDGTPMTAKDVAATFNRLADPKSGSNALSALDGVLSKGGVTAVGANRVRFELDAPNGNFAYIASSDNYNAVILPAAYELGSYEKQKFPGTGRLKLERYNAQTGATFVRNEQYWDKARMANLDKVEFKFFADEQPALLALQGGSIDAVNQISVGNARAILDNPAYTIISTRSAAARVLHMRVDRGPFEDKRVRQALALSLDRKAITETLFQKRAEIGNDSPFAPIYPSTDKSVPQRTQDIAKAKQLLAAAGKPDGFSAPLTAIRALEVPDYAVLVKNAAAGVGINLTVGLQDPGSYYGKAVFGQSPWLDADCGITDYGHRGVPNVLLSSQLTSRGVWNSAHIKNAALDKLIAQYVADLDLPAQRRTAKTIQTMLLDETPLVHTYFYDFLAASSKRVQGIVPNAAGQLFVSEASMA